MAQKVEVHLVDDLDGNPVNYTLAFAPDGKDYAINLATTNAEKLHETMHLYVTTGRNTTRGGGPRGTGTRASSTDSDTARIRA